MRSTRPKAGSSFSGMGRAESEKEEASARVSGMEERLTAERRRADLAAAVASLPEDEGQLADALEEVSRQKNDREGALSAWHEAERSVNSAESSLSARKNDLA